VSSVALQPLQTGVGRALCIGVDAEDDARTFAAIARDGGFAMTETLLGQRATRALVRARIAHMAAASKPGDLFLLTFSGHGGQRQVRVENGDAHTVGTWQLSDGCLHDGQLRDDLAKFRPDVRVLVISDNCSGAIPSPPASVHGDAIQASVLVIGACQRDQYADGPGLPGHFAQVLRRTLSAEAFDGAYAELHAELCQRMPDYQKPDYYRLGVRSAAFEAQRPFTV
jgi:hypothetical protein